MNPLRIIIAGGGTGGHIFPAVAIGHALKRLRPDTQLLFVGAKGKMEMEKIPQEGFEIVGLNIAGLNRTHFWKNILLPFKMVWSYFSAASIIRKFRPNAVIGVGGYASFPILNAAQDRNIPTLVQEQNSYAGKSNKILAKKAKSICVAYPQMEQFFPAAKISITGNPVRNSIVASKIGRDKACEFFGLNPEKKTVFVVGGSLGASSVNMAMQEGLAALLQEDVQLLWQTGKGDYDKCAEAAAAYGENVKVHAFIREMEYAYAAADVIISRAGALAVSEICIVGKPVIFVPYPYAAEDHQTSNAKSLADRKAAWIVKDADVHEELIKKVNALLADEATQEVMKRQLDKLAITDADERIANKIFSIATA